jgi:hypothetical protein
MEAVQQDARAIDGPTLSAAVATLLFAIVAGVLLGHLPQEGQLSGALDALKNLIYVLTVPFFDIMRRLFARRKARIEHTAPAETPNLLSVAFVSALVLFVLIEAISWLTGFGMGGVCAVLAQSISGVNVGNCLAIGINILSSVIIGPIMIAMGIATGWIWQRAVSGRFLITLLLFAIAVAVLFALDFFILLQNTPDAAQTLRDQFNAVGPVRQIGLQVVILGVSTAIGYGARRLWSAFAGAFA